MLNLQVPFPSTCYRLLKTSDKIQISIKMRTLIQRLSLILNYLMFCWVSLYIFAEALLANCDYHNRQHKKLRF